MAVPNFAIVIGWGTDNLIYNNLIYRNRGGIQLGFYSSNTGVYNNTIYANTPFGGIAVSQWGTATIKNNIVYLNASNIDSENPDSVITDNLFTNPNFMNPSSADFRVQAGSAAVDAGVTINNVSDDYAGPRAHRVFASM